MQRKYVVQQLQFEEKVTLVSLRTLIPKLHHGSMQEGLRGSGIGVRVPVFGHDPDVVMSQRLAAFSLHPTATANV